MSNGNFRATLRQIRITLEWAEQQAALAENGTGSDVPERADSVMNCLGHAERDVAAARALWEAWRASQCARLRVGG